MSQKQLYRDYELTLTNSQTDAKLTIKNDNPLGVGLRISFNISLLPVQNQVKSALLSFCTFEVNVFNFKQDTQKQISDGEYNRLTLKVGYRDQIQGGNRNSQAVLIEADIFNSYTFRLPDASIVTSFLGIQNQLALSALIDVGDCTKFAVSLTNKVEYTRKQIFDYYVNKYLASSNLKIEEKNLSGFDSRYNVLDPDVGFTFAPNTTVGSAISQIVGDRVWYIDNLNTLYVLPVPTSDTDFQPEFPISDEVFLDQTTGLLDIPIISPSKAITAKTLLNPALRPLVRVKIDTQLGLKSSTSRVPIQTFQNAFGAPAYSAKTVEAVIMSANYQGDSRTGQFTTTFQTFPADYVKILG